MSLRLALNSPSSSPSFLSARIRGTHYYIQFAVFFFNLIYSRARDEDDGNPEISLEIHRRKKKEGGGAKTLFIQCKQQEKGQPRNPTGNVHKQPPDLSQQQHREVSVPAHKVGWSAWTSTPVKN
jgi:hypothetical protein